MGKGTFFSRNLRAERELKHLTQEYMAYKLHMTKAAYARWERGEREPKTEAIINIADVLDIPVQNLFRRERKQGENDVRVFQQINLLYDSFNNMPL